MICALVLAAGRSRRMGTQKLLLPVGGRPVITRIVDEVLDSPVDQVFVVINPDGAGITTALADRRVRFVVNADVEGQMLSSVRCGLAAMPQACEAVLVVLGDQPALTADIVARLVLAFQTSGRGLVVPTAGGRRGHPLLFAMPYRDEVLQGYDEVGLRGLLQAHPEDVCEVEVAAPGILEDLDVPEDFERIVAGLGATDKQREPL
jgi:molybdenum cofactor cytidylyltransferase